jgi:hypothetical protein
MERPVEPGGIRRNGFDDDALFSRRFLERMGFHVVHDSGTGTDLTERNRIFPVAAQLAPLEYDRAGDGCVGRGAGIALRCFRG